MKKALSVFLMAAMAFGAFADEPVADVKVSEFTGNAAVTWGVNLDSGKTGFKNDAEVTLKLNLLNGGNKSTSGDGVWGELVIKTDGDTFVGWNGNGKVDANKGMGKDLNFGVKVDTAKIHFGPAYVGITSGDTQTGKLKMDAAIRSADSDNAVTVPNKGPDGYSQGVVVGFDSDIVKVDVDVRSIGTTQYSNDYALAGEVELKAVENLSVKAGASANFNDSNTIGYSASAGYKLGLNDTFFVRPQVGYAGDANFADGEKVADSNVLAAGVLLGWGDIGQDKNAGVYFLDDGDAKKVTPGVGVVATFPNLGKETIIASVQPSFFSGELIPGLTAAAYADIWMIEDADDFTPMAFILGAKYAIGVDAVTITPQASILYANEDYAVINLVAASLGVSANKLITDGTIAGINDALNVKVGVDVAGLIDNTTLSVVWASGDLIDDQAGTLNFNAKIAL